MNEVYTCPVCGYPALEVPPDGGEICPCCGTEYGYDPGATDDDLRRLWLEKGAPWFSHATPPPAGWNPVAQLVRAGYRVETAKETVPA